MLKEIDSIWNLIALLIELLECNTFFKTKVRHQKHLFAHWNKLYQVVSIVLLIQIRFWVKQ